jgi:putative ABC transport system permease protein
MDYRVAQSLFAQELHNRTTYILVKLEPGANAAMARSEIERRLPHNNVRAQAEWASRSRSYWTDSTGLGLNMITTVFLGCLVGVVVVAQTLYTSAMEHIKEFATIKAIGGRDRDVYWILGKQSVIAAVLGFGLGSLMSFALRPAMASIDLKLIVSPALAAWVFVGTVVFCVAASAVSFKKVAGLDPALVFRG